MSDDTGSSAIFRDWNLEQFPGQEARLQQYKAVFINQGYDMTEDFIDIGVKCIDQIAQDEGISLPGHIQRLKRAVTSLQSRMKNPPTEHTDDKQTGTSQDTVKSPEATSLKM